MMSAVEQVLIAELAQQGPGRMDMVPTPEALSQVAWDKKDER